MFNKSNDLKFPNEEEIINIIDSDKKNTIKQKYYKDYITFHIKRKNIECIFLFIFIILLLFLILNDLFQNKLIVNGFFSANIKYRNYINVAYAFDSNYHYITHVSMKSIMLSQNVDT